MPDDNSAPDLSQFGDMLSRPQEIPDLQGGQPSLQVPTTQGRTPNAVEFIKQMVHPSAHIQPGDVAPRPPTRLGAFESFLGNSLQSFASGMSAPPNQGGQALSQAMQSPYQADLQNYGLQQQARQQQSLEQERQSQAQLRQAQAQAVGEQVQVQMPDGSTRIIPASLYAKMYPAQIAAQSRENVANINAKSRQGVIGTQGQNAAMLQGMRGTLATQLQQLRDTSAERVAQIRAGMQRPMIVMGPNGPTYVLPSQAVGQAPGRAAAPADLLKVSVNQKQINLAIPRMQELHDNADVISSMIDAGKIAISVGAGGDLQATIGRGVTLTPRERKFASDFQSMAEDINLLRGPLGATGFRGAEAFDALQVQRGRLAQNPAVFMGVLENSLASMKGIQDSNQDFINNYGKGGRGNSGSNGNSNDPFAKFGGKAR